MTDRREVVITAQAKWNHTGIRLLAGTTYTFRVPPAARWKDWTVSCDAAGHDHWSTRPFKRWLRVPSAAGKPVPFFALVGALGEDLTTAFPIGLGGKPWSCPVDGELVCFANDVDWAYCNNSGNIPLTVEW